MNYAGHQESMYAGLLSQVICTLSRLMLNIPEHSALARDQAIQCYKEFIIVIYPETSRGLCFSQHGKAHQFRSRYLIL